MIVFLIRHSLAIDAGPTVPDAHRWLSADGRDRALSVGARLRQEGARFDRLLTSPLVRAVQTAELLAREVPSGDVMVLDALAPGVSAEVVARHLGGAGLVALVGHAPGISAVGAVLVGKPSFPGMRPGQVAVIEDGRPRYGVNPVTVEVEQLVV